jgi:anaerobic magnesium-protoporphyrin IX monomethyl ester cyclase
MSIKEEDKIVLLLYPRFLDDMPEFPDMPLNLLCLGAYLDEKGYKVAIIDENNWDENVFYSKLREYLPRAICVGLSTMTAQVHNGLRISKFVKDLSPDTKVIWGGKHVTLFPEQTAENQYIDIAVKGEAEETILEIIKAIENNTPFDKIQAVTLFKDGQFISNPLRPFVDINKLPPLKYEQQEILKKFSMKEILAMKRWGPPLLTSRGCPYRCSFCINKILKEGIRIRKSDLVVDDLRRLNEKYNINKVRVMDEFFFISKKRVQEIVQGIFDDHIDIKWTSTIRANCFNDNFLNVEFAKEVQRAGCVDMGIGAESGSQKILDYLKKDIKVEDLIRSAKTLSKVNIHANYSFMIGLPGETLDDIKKTLKVIYEITRIHKNIEIYGPQLFRPYPGSDLYDEIQHQLDLPKKLEDWKTNSLLFGDTARIPINFPWLSVDEFNLKKLRFYGSNENGFTQPTQYRKFYYSLASFFLKSLVRLRVKHSFYNFPIDYQLYNYILNLSWRMRLRKTGNDGLVVDGNYNQDTAGEVLVGMHRNFKNS